MKFLKFRTLMQIVIAITVLFTMACGKGPSAGQDQGSPGAGPTPQEAPPANDADHQEAERQELEDPKKVAPFLFEPKRQVEVKRYSQPKAVVKKLKENHPELVVAQSQKFRVDQQNLKIDSKEGLITFSGILKVPRKKDERIELQCHFDPNAQWECGNMYPTNEKIALERRLQGRVSCLDTYRCNQVGLELFVLINGKLESQTFQSQKFEIRRAGSGDAEDYYEVAKPPKGFGKTNKPKSDPKVLEKPTQVDPPEENPNDEVEEPEVVEEVDAAEAQFGPDEEPMTPKEVEELINDQNSVVEVDHVVPLPKLESNDRFSITGADKIEPDKSSGVKEQAIGKHSGGRLEKAAALTDGGGAAGFKLRGRAGESYGTDRLVGILKAVSQKIASEDTTHLSTKSPIVVAAMSHKNGGRMCNAQKTSCHASHQTGLDADVVFPSLKPVNGLWDACKMVVYTYKDKRGRTRRSRGCARGGGVDKNFDSERFWEFLKLTTCAPSDPVIAMFVDKEIKRHMCEFVKNKRDEDWKNPKSCAFKALKVMKHWPNHHNHVHVRLKCPGNSKCRASNVDLGNTTGC